MIEEIENYNSEYFLANIKESEKAVKDHASQYIIVDGIVYEEIGEPRYEIDTFGLGHNHGGTGMFIENYYNPNVSKNCYFNALEREKAIAYGKKIAAARGDTESIDEIGADCEIKVLIPEAVRCNPQKEHNEGNQFMNRMEQLVEASSDRNEAALLVMCESIAEINKL